MTTVAEKIKELRLSKGLSQNDLAGHLKISRPTYISIESGKKQPNMIELKQIASITGSSLEELLFDALQVSTSDFGLEKYKQIVLNCLQYGGDTNDKKITKTKLAKLVYLADFSWFYKKLEPMSGLAYRRIQQGPVPDQYFRAIDELYESGDIGIKKSRNGTAFMISLNEKTAPSSHLSKEEIGLIKKICRRWQNRHTKEIVDFTHGQLPWKICRPGELIPYELITQEETENVY